MRENESVVLSNVAKKKYLTSLMGKIYKALHIIEEEPKTGYSPAPFIYSQILSVNAANSLFDGGLVEIIIKLRIIYDNYGSIKFSECKKQIFEIAKIINNRLSELEEEDDNN